MTHRSGFVTIIGKPNVGKSTLLNHFLKQKITITSHKPQTTRHAIRGILSEPTSQIIFIDTPGIHKARHQLGLAMTETALQTLGTVDLILYMISGVEKMNDEDDMIFHHLAKVKTPTFLIINKIDLTKDVPRLEILIARYKERFAFAGVFAISATEGIYTDMLLEDIKKMLPDGPKYYPDDQITDHPERFLIAEIIREKVLRLTEEEVPHSVMILIDSMKPAESIPDLLDIHATVIVERDSQKGIIIGKGGHMIKKIGSAARQDILALLGMKIYLDLHCKVIKNWRNKAYHLQNFGFKDSQ